jgi:NDP-hexose 2,3-enoyl reductase
MRYRQLGTSGLHVSAIGLGTRLFGGRVDAQSCHQLLSGAADAGVNLIDTADVYGRGIGSGECEKIVGDWLSGSSTRREQIVLASKVGGPMGGTPNDTGLSARHIRRSCENSLRRLQTDHLDLYQIHQPDPKTRWEETWSEFERLTARGDVIYAGLSNMSTDQALRALDAAPAPVRRRIACYQGEHHLGSTDHSQAPDQFARLGLGFLAYRPLAGGALARPPGSRADQTSGQPTSPGSDLAPRLARIASEHGQSVAQLAVGWLLADPQVSSVLIGPRTPGQLADLLAGKGRPLNPALMTQVSEACTAS